MRGTMGGLRGQRRSGYASFGARSRDRAETGGRSDIHPAASPEAASTGWAGVAGFLALAFLAGIGVAVLTPGFEGSDGIDRATVAALPEAAPRDAIAARRYPLCSGMPRKNCIVDGDTFYFGSEKIRIADIDTPEVFSPRCAEEKWRGDRATRRLAELLAEGPVTLARIDRDEDVYGRKLRIIMRDGRSLGDTLVAEGLAHRWVGHKLPWCS